MDDYFAKKIHGGEHTSTSNKADRRYDYWSDYINDTMKVSIFLSPPNIEELRKRLVLRSTETEDEINKRLSRFEEEDNLKKEFDYNLINDNFETTFEKIKKIINRHKKED